MENELTQTKEGEMKNEERNPLFKNWSMEENTDGINKFSPHANIFHTNDDGRVFLVKVRYLSKGYGATDEMIEQRREVAHLINATPGFLKLAELALTKPVAGSSRLWVESIQAAAVEVLKKAGRMNNEEKG